MQKYAKIGKIVRFLKTALPYYKLWRRMVPELFVCSVTETSVAASTFPNWELFGKSLYVKTVRTGVQSDKVSPA